MIKHSVILLKRDLLRSLNVKNNIQNYIPDLKIVKAFDHKEKDVISFCKENNINISNDYRDNGAKFGGVANVISHTIIWKEMIRGDIPEMVVMEDDAKINSGHLIHLRNVKKELPKDYSLCLLYVSKSRYLNNDSVKIDNKKYINKGYRNYGMVSYMISLAGAKKMLKEFENISYLIDVQINQLIKNTSGHNVFCAKKPFVSMKILPTNVLNTKKIKKHLTY